MSLLERAVKIKKQTLVEEHPLRLVWQHKLAGAYLANTQVTGAVALLEQVIKLLEQALAKDHPNRWHRSRCWLHCTGILAATLLRFR